MNDQVSGAGRLRSSPVSLDCPKGAGTMHARWFGSALLLTALGLLGSGCGSGSKFVKVNGVLKFNDGSPIAGAMVMFEPEDKEGRSAAGFTDTSGEFDLTTLNSGDGALPGKYLVVVTKRSAAALAAGEGGSS